MPALGPVFFGFTAKKLSKLATKGGVVLSGIGVAKGAYDMCQASSRHEKNEIFVETISGTVGGLAAGAAAAFLLMSPVTWIGVIVIGAASALAGYGTGKKAREFYNSRGESFDLVSLTRADSICNFYSEPLSPEVLKYLNDINSMRSL